ncbi:MAG: hypothetical protein ACD_62C00176G0002 [uncultured bacterium]|nr:MAG: hypothetical protein ACD_62C00176G0002 [uncultured bacterium]
MRINALILLTSSLKLCRLSLFSKVKEQQTIKDKSNNLNQL